MKKKGEEDFDNPTRCHHGPEICELVDAFILTKNKSYYARTVQSWIYINDDLSTFKNFSGPNIKKDKKEVIKKFKSFGLSIPFTTNVKSANYLDVNFILTPDI